MSLRPGETLGPYEILAPIGAGGMGEVWKARDTKLDREVAIKVLPVALAQHPEPLARFEREAKVLASLNHPNIAQIYGIEESNGFHALVMELVPGTTLKGPLSLETTLNYAKQIADALEAAHEKGITHRDLKPANVMVTLAGVIKVLDFGLAAVNRAFTPGEGSTSPTLSIGGTQTGMIMGTAGYMSPEQARGETVDKRADIWAFGVVLWELLTGKRLFGGVTVSQILASVLKDEPDFKQVPPRVRRLLRRCLEKDPRKRLRDIGDAMELVDVDAEAAPASVTTPSLSGLGRLAGIAAIVLAVVAAGLGVVAWRATRPPELRPLVRLDVDLGAGISLGSPLGADTILSPDGTRMVYVSQGKLFTRRMDQPKAVELAGTDGAFAPFFSPDGQWVAFFSESKLKKISVEGGAAVALCDAGASALGGSWGEDGNIIAAITGGGGALSKIPSAGGAPTPVTQLAQGEAEHSWPQILPGGKAILFTTNASLTFGFDRANIEVMSLADHHRKTLQRGGTFGRYLPASNGNGYLLYINNGTLFAVPFDSGKLDVQGTPSPVLEEVAYSTITGSAQFDFSQHGTLVYLGGRAAGGNLVTVQWLDAVGGTQPLLSKPGGYRRPHVSPDDQRLAMEDGSDIWVYEARRDTMTRLTFGGDRNANPVWSPEGRYVVFSGDGGMWWVRSDGAGKPQLLIQGKNRMVPFSITADGKRLAYAELNPGTLYDIWTVPIEDDAVLRAGKPEIFLKTSADERQSTFSPDGRWLAYASNESGTFQVYVRAFPDNGGKWQISNAGGVYPVWSSNGHELFFRADDNRIMVATYAAKADSFVPDKPRVWSNKQLANLGAIGASNYDLAPDGKRIAALMPVEEPEARQAQNHVIFLENFFDELQRKVPAVK
jgi:Tol biopolymer transport system component